MRVMSPALFGERLRALRGNKIQKDVAAAVGLPTATYQRYEKGETEKLAFDDVIRLAKYYNLTPNEMAALADLWTVPEQMNPRDEVHQFANVFLNFLLDLTPSRLEFHLSMFENLMEIENQKALNGGEAFINTSALPEWLRQKKRGD